MTKKSWLLPLVCAALVLLCHLGVCTFRLVRDTSLAKSGALAPRQLHLDDFTLESVIRRGDEDGNGVFVSTDADPWLIYEPGGVFATTGLTFAAAPSRPPGAVTLYYTTREGQPFSERQKLWAQQDEAGNWVFRFPAKRVVALRLDPDAVGGVRWEVQRITLNEAQPSAAYFVPDAFTAFCLLAAVPLLWALLAEGAALLRPLRALLMPRGARRRK